MPGKACRSVCPPDRPSRRLNRAALAPLFNRLETDVLSAERLHDDTMVPVLAKRKIDTGRIWVYVRNEKPFGGMAPRGVCSITRAIGPASIPRLTWQLQRNLPSVEVNNLPPMT